jgi:hypothetical protein
MVFAHLKILTILTFSLTIVADHSRPLCATISDHSRPFCPGDPPPGTAAPLCPALTGAATAALTVHALAGVRA